MSSKNIARPALTPAGHLAESRLQTVLGYQLAQATLVTDVIFKREVGDSLELRQIEYTVLTLIAENPTGTPARLARALAVTPPHISAIVDGLVERGLVLRAASSEDRRAQALTLSSKGVDLARKATNRIVAAERASLTLTSGEQAILAELLHKVACARAGTQLDARGDRS